MREMTRPEFEAYEKRLEDVLARIGNSINEADRRDFGEVAAAAREIVEIRRARLDISEQQDALKHQQIDREYISGEPSEGQTQLPDTGEKYYEQTAEAAHDALTKIRIAREALADEHSLLSASAYQGDLERGLHMAAYLAVSWGNKHVHEAAKVDPELTNRIGLYEKNREEHDISYGTGRAGEGIPEVTKGDATLLGYYEEGSDEYRAGLAIADHENGLAFGGWGAPAAYLSVDDSEAAWARFDQRSAEWLSAHASMQQGLEGTEARFDKLPVAHSESYAAGVAGKPIPDEARGNEELLGLYAKGLKQFETA